MKITAIGVCLTFYLSIDGFGQGLPTLPSGVLNLTNWKITLPVNTSHPGNPDEILQPELAGFQSPAFFRVNTEGNGVVFTAPCGGATTGGSSYPRSELREMANNGTEQASWSTDSGTNTMEITQAITHLPVAKPHVVAGQIHGSDDDILTCRLEGRELFFDRNGDRGPLLTENYEPGDVFTIKFIARNGGIECYYNGQFIFTHQVSASGCYFKAGCYPQSNPDRGDAPTAYGEVVIFSLTLNAPSGPQADLAAFSIGPSEVPARSNFNYTVAVTNFGPAAAADVIVSDILPEDVGFVSASEGGQVAGEAVVWPTIPTLSSGEGRSYAVTVTAPASGTITNRAVATSSTPDTNSANNSGASPGSQTITTISSSQQLSVLPGVIVLNPQTGRFEQTVIITNPGPGTVDAVRLYVQGLRSGVHFQNASGTNAGRAYAQYSLPLLPGATVTFVLKFYVPDRGTFSDTLQAEAASPEPARPVVGGLAVSRVFLLSAILGEPRVVVEFATIPGRSYTVIYRDPGSPHWLAAMPPIIASATVTQWFDDGPPETTSRPGPIGSRDYRVLAGLPPP